MKTKDSSIAEANPTVLGLYISPDIHCGPRATQDIGEAKIDAETGNTMFAFG